MLKILNLLIITLSISTSVYANENINNMLINDINQVNTNTTETYFNLRDIMQSANFSIKQNPMEVVATFTDDPNRNFNNNNFRTTKRTIIHPQYNILNPNINGHFDNQNEVINNTSAIDDYIKAFFLIGRQESLSLLNCKLNNKKALNNVEKDLMQSLDNIKYKKFGDNKRLQWVVPITDNDYNIMIAYNQVQYEVPKDFYRDVAVILKKNKVNNPQDQIKLDIFSQMLDNDKYTGKHDNAFTISYKYWMRTLYNNVDQ